LFLVFRFGVVKMSRVRFGVIGVKGIGQAHITAISKVPEVELKAVSDIVEEIGKPVAEKLGIRYFKDYRDMLDSKDVDAVCVCTPHYLHASMSIDALKAGKHVLCEKPMAMSVKECDDMISAAKKSGGRLGVVFQNRFSAVFQEARRIIHSGEIGNLTRSSMEACRFRTQHYYDDSPWRKSWAGSGAGVLINQAVHDLDLYYFLVGKPETVLGVVETKMHDAEVEDMASAVILFEGGVHGLFHANLVESPSSDRIVVAGSKGKIVVEQEQIRMGRPETPVDEFIKGRREVWSSPKSSWIDVKVERQRGSHVEVLRDFVQAVLSEREPTVTGEEGRIAIEMVNAIVLSNYSCKPVKIPVDREEYSRLLARLEKEKCRAKPHS